MAESVVVRARIDEKTKNEASAVLAAMGLTGFRRFPVADGACCEGEGLAL